VLTASGVAVPLVEFVPLAWREGWLLASWALSGLGLCLFLVNTLPFLMASTGQEERNHAFSAQTMLGLLAGFVGSLVGGALPKAFAAVLGIPAEDPAVYRYALWLSAALLIPAMLALLAAREVQTEVKKATIVARGRAPLGLIGVIGLVALLRYAGQSISNTFFNVYLDDGLGAATATIGALKAAGQLLAVPTALATPLLIARWQKGRTVVLGSLGQALSLALLALAPHWAPAGFGFASASALFWIGTTASRVFSQELVTPGWRGAMSGVMMMGAGLSSTGTAFVGGYVITALGYRSLFLMGTGLTIAGALFFAICFPREMRGSAGQKEEKMQGIQDAKTPKR
jgi:MFS family permease